MFVSWILTDRKHGHLPLKICVRGALVGGKTENQMTPTPHTIIIHIIHANISEHRDSTLLVQREHPVVEKIVTTLFLVSS